MRQAIFTETQIVSILKEADAGWPVNEIWRTYSISAARQRLGRYLTFSNQHRPHRTLNGHTPEQVYCDNLTTRLTAA